MNKDNICLNCKHRNNYWHCEVINDNCDEETFRCTNFEYVKTNFDVVTENPATLARFMHEMDVEATMNDTLCRFCGQYELLDGPVCNIECKEGFKLWLEKEVSE